jgi:hypothetical protein
MTITKQSEIAAHLKGRKVARIVPRPFNDGRGGKAYDPEIYFDNGDCLRFMVLETDVGEYGLEMILYEAAADWQREGVGGLK